MAYKLYRKPFDRIYDILDNYNCKIAILKSDVQCRYGVFCKDTIVYVKKNKLSQNDGKAKIEMKIYDCSERNDLGEYEPYKTEDIYEISVESIEDLAAVFENIFDINDEKTKYHKKYADLRQKVRNYSIDVDYVTDIIKNIEFLSYLGFVLLLVGKFIGKTPEFISVCNIGIPISATVGLFCTAIILILNHVTKHKMNKLNEASGRLHNEIMAKQPIKMEICTKA